MTPDDRTEETALWRSVICQAITDALSTRTGPEHEYARRTARASFDTDSRDFRHVCDMADLDPEIVCRAFEAALDRGATTTELRKKASKVKTPNQRGRPLSTYEHNGQKRTLVEIADELGISHQTLYYRLWSGKSLSEAIAMGKARRYTTPAGVGRQLLALN